MSDLILPGSPEFDAPLPTAPTVLRKIHPGDLLGRLLALDTIGVGTR